MGSTTNEKATKSPTTTLKLTTTPPISQTNFVNINIVGHADTSVAITQNIIASDLYNKSQHTQKEGFETYVFRIAWKNVRIEKPNQGQRRYY